MKMSNIPKSVRESPLFKSGGYAVFENFPDNRMIECLTQEAINCYQNSDDQQVNKENDQPMRGGIPGRRFFSSNGREYLDNLYQSAWLTEQLSSICGYPVEPSGTRGSYSYYVRPGDYLDIHRDIEFCDITFITILYDNMEYRSDAGGLVVFPGCFQQDISELRKKKKQWSEKVKITTHQSIILYGGYLPHMVTPCVDSQVRIISALCYRA